MNLPKIDAKTIALGAVAILALVGLSIAIKARYDLAANIAQGAIERASA